MRVLIYGGGAVGLGLASCLLKARVRTDIIAKEDTVQALRHGGLLRQGIFGSFHADAGSFDCAVSLNDFKDKLYDYILVCTKSFDSFNAAKDIVEHKFLTEDKTILVLSQNGWGNAEIFTSFFEKNKVYNARIITGFERPKKNEVVITVHADAIHIGSLYGGDTTCVEPLCGSITKGGIPCEPAMEIGKDLWAKMLYNCALNPMGAILDVPYGALAENERTRNIMDHIVQEVFAVMKAAGYQTHWQSSQTFLDVFYSRLVPDTAKHFSSTLQDIKAHKRTEIDALNGAVIELAKKHGLDVPYNQYVYNLIKSF